ncbi:acetylornithine deacetylase [Halobacillus halophilus]|uniref:Acetylornithine deacetylase or succinyl-diaminopimelate desuccinylase n=1 Tax=Halobacillus halophilus (strain ATCC 35676 / DSM 2266 / JCM 20832 / KCTC 3685 / LMG 17431 / NBRC 102448 / NCIMB 2269) TaxID=866895 RepID=I0JQU6_HALH3|nr:acetylornithine deacetylase [Halobacillus halophilus]CCG46516.1 acetylornithine deacetylase or succinyl-diaminopimelate desuccinylase [Halobacillus halophilus DSM 2266]
MELNKDNIHEWLQGYREEGTKLLQRLVQADSTQGNEAEAQAVVIETLKELGMTIDRWDPDEEEVRKHPYFASSRENFKGSPNVVGVQQGTGEGRSIIFNGHIDVVPAGDRTQWEHDPYSGKVIDGRMYGRGVTDMKGGNVSMLLALKVLKNLGIRLKGDVIFQSVIEEESGGTGTLAAVMKGYKAEAALIPEPTNMKIFPKQQGSMWFRIYVKGRSAHGGTRYQGVSAIEKSMMVIDHIRQLEKQRNDQINDPLYQNIPIPIPINVGKIEGGDWPSSVADLVKIEGRMGISPEETIENAKAEMENWLKQLKDKDPWFEEHPTTLEWFGARWLPGAMDQEHPFMNTLVAGYRNVLGADPVIEASPWGTDGGLLTEAGKTPSLVFGPGVTEMAHYPNEYIEMDKVFEAAEIMALTLMEWCGTEE